LAIPRSTLGAWVGNCGVQLQPVVDALKAEILSHSVVHADETPVQMLKPGSGKTHRAYLWAYAAGAFEETKALVYDLGRRTFFDLHASNKSQIAHSALEQIGRIYDIEREVKELLPDERQRIRQEQSKPLLDALHQWMILNRQKITDGSATAKALDYSLRRWGAPTRFVDNGQLPIDNNPIENQIRPIAIGRSNWLFAGSLRAGKRAAAIMSLI
jgi:transposase